MEMIHVLFAPDGNVSLIGECPEGMEPETWFRFLSRNTTDAYESFAGGRGVFRLEKEVVEKLKLQAA